MRAGETLYKFTRSGGFPTHGKGRWSLPDGSNPGKWWHTKGEIIPCANGLHLCRDTDLIKRVSDELYVAEYKGKRIDEHDQVVVRSARLVRKLDGWNEVTARLLAADAAECVLYLFEDERPDDDRPRKSIEAARAFARGEIDAETMYAAGSAAGYAARSAGYAAGYAAWYAARSAGSAAWSAGSAAWSAWYAARSAGSAAWSAGSAAWSAGSAARSAGSAGYAARSAVSVALSKRILLYAELGEDAAYEPLPDVRSIIAEAAA